MVFDNRAALLGSKLSARCAPCSFSVAGQRAKRGDTLKPNGQKEGRHFSWPGFLEGHGDNIKADLKNPSEKLAFELPSIGCPRCAALRVGTVCRIRPIRNAYLLAVVL